MVENIKRINNPLTIIAVFAALAEINATVAISLISKELHYIFIWFIIGFPTMLVILFFVTLNFNTKVMYSPSDYKDDKTFIESIFGVYDGRGSLNSKQVISNIIAKELEARIIQTIQPKLEKLETENNIGDLKREIVNIKKALKEATEKTAKEISGLSLLSAELKNKMLNFYRNPANYLTIYGIVKTNGTTVAEVATRINGFFIPEKWEDISLTRLVAEGIVIGDRKKFSVNPQYLGELVLWTERNEAILSNMSLVFKELKSRPQNEDATKQTIETIKLLAEKLAF